MPATGRAGPGASQNLRTHLPQGWQGPKCLRHPLLPCWAALNLGAGVVSLKPGLDHNGPDTCPWGHSFSGLALKLEMTFMAIKVNSILGFILNKMCPEHRLMADKDAGVSTGSLWVENCARDISVPVSPPRSLV